jgi:hypothetical protein
MSGRVLDPSTLDGGRREDGEAATRSVARLLAAAVTILLVSFIVVTRSSDALQPAAGSPGNRFEAGRVALRDDDAGRTLFDLPAMVPGRLEENCITVSYAGTVYPATVRLAASSVGSLAPGLAMTVDAGAGGGFGDCAGFQSERRLYEGTLRDFGDRYGRRGQGLAVFRADGPSEGRTYRFRFVLSERAAGHGGSATADFLWEAVPS